MTGVLIRKEIWIHKEILKYVVHGEKTQKEAMSCREASVETKPAGTWILDF